MGNSSAADEKTA